MALPGIISPISGKLMGPNLTNWVSTHLANPKEMLLHLAKPRTALLCPFLQQHILLLHYPCHLTRHSWASDSIEWTWLQRNGCVFFVSFVFSFEVTEIHVNMRQYFFLMKRNTSSPYIQRVDSPIFFWIGVICNEFFCLTKLGSLLEGAVLFHNLPVDEHPSKGRDQSMVFF